MSGGLECMKLRYSSTSSVTTFAGAGKLLQQSSIVSFLSNRRHFMVLILEKTSILASPS